MSLQEFEQLLANGIIAGCSVGLLAVSYALIMSVTQRFHVAYVATYVGGVYAGVWAQSSLHLPIGVAIVIGLVVATAFGVAIEGLFYRPIAARAARQGRDPLVPIFICSLGVTVVVENMIAYHFNTQPLPFSVIQPKALQVLQAHITTFNAVSVGVCVVLTAGLAVFLRKSRRGQWISAVRVNAEMANVVGIKSRRIFLLVFAIGSFLSGVLGMISATNNAASPDMGFDLVFLGFVVAFVAGLNSGPGRIFVVGLIIEELSSLSGLWVAAQWQSAVVFGVLLVYLVAMSLRRWGGISAVRTSFAAAIPQLSKQGG